MKITGLRATTVSIPLEAVLLHAHGAHWGRFVRTIVEVETDEGLVGLGEIGGGGESAERAIAGLETYLVGHNPFELESLRFKISNPTAGLYNNRVQLHAAIEFACLDLIGQSLGVPVHALLGGKVRETVPFASYLFFRHRDPATRAGEVRSAEQVVEHAKRLKREHGFTAHKLKGGVYPPEHELECYLALAESLPGDRLRYDPNAVLSVEQGVRFADASAHCANDYLEDPTWGMNGMRQIRRRTNVALATNTVVTSFEQLAANVRDPAVDVVLLDTTIWGGIRPCLKAAAVCETFQLGVGVHSSGELGIQLATMLHLGAVLPSLTFAADSHYHHLVDDVIAGGKLRFEDGAIAVPDGPGLGVSLDRDRLERYAEHYREMGDYAYDRDPGRPDWYPLVPNQRWADPSVTLPLPG